ncbi:MAG: hypothetical protein GY937_13365 [bacterium]|nr:hypothetical protein [bacterium]
MPKRGAVEHFVEGYDAWQLGVKGFFSRWRGIGLTGLLTMGVPWWTSLALSLLNNTLPQLPLAAAAWASAGGAVAVALLIYNRRRTQRSLAIKRRLHELTHYVRDEFTSICRATEENPEPSEYHAAKAFREFIVGLCDRTESYFQELLLDQRIATAIRLASATGEGDVEYVTVGRSKNFNPAREATSEPIPANEGICAYLAEKQHSKGVLIYNDIDEAVKIDALMETENERRFPDEVASLMVAPLNAWSGTEEQLIGLLYVASRHKNAFSVVDIDSMRFVADLVANAISTTVARGSDRKSS